MRNGVYYLNNSGSRWVVYDNGKKQKVWAYINGELLQRTAQSFEMFGNFAAAMISYKGVKHSILRYAIEPEGLSPLDNIVLES